MSAVRRGAMTVLAAVRLVVRRAFEILFALILIFEEWGWRPLAALLARLARFPFIARLEAVIAGLPPYAALVVFVIPPALLFPLKLLALYLITSGKVVLAGLLFVGAKIASTAFVARLFMLTRPALMRIGWFARGYNWLMPWKDAAFAAIRASWAWRYGRIVKYRVGQAVKARWALLRPHVLVLRDRAIAEARRLIARLRG